MLLLLFHGVNILFSAMENEISMNTSETKSYTLASYFEVRVIGLEFANNNRKLFGRKNATRGRV